VTRESLRGAKPLFYNNKSPIVGGKPEGANAPSETIIPLPLDRGMGLTILLTLNSKGGIIPLSLYGQLGGGNLHEGLEREVVCSCLKWN